MLEVWIRSAQLPNTAKRIIGKAQSLSMNTAKKSHGLSKKEDKKKRHHHHKGKWEARKWGYLLARAATDRYFQGSAQG
jgi:ribosomal protein L35